MNQPNPLITERVDSTTWYSGIGIIESLDMTIDGIISESWVDTTLGAVSTAADAYRFRADQDVTLIRGLAKAADGMAAMVSITGAIVSTARTLVRDLIGECVSILLVRLPLWTAEEVFSLGTATPYVGSQFAALVAKWGARIARVLRAVIRSLDNLSPLARQLDEIVATIADLLKRRSTETGPIRAVPAPGPHLVSQP